MFHRTALHTLLFITWAVVLLVEENHRLTCQAGPQETLTDEATQDEAKHPLNDKSKVSDLALSLLDDQRNLIQMLKEYSKPCCIKKEALKELRELKLAFTTSCEVLNKLIEDNEEERHNAKEKPKIKNRTQNGVKTRREKVNQKRNEDMEAAVIETYATIKRVKNVLRTKTDDAVRSLESKIQELSQMLHDTMEETVKMVKAWKENAQPGLDINNTVPELTTHTAKPRRKIYRLYEDHVTQPYAIVACELLGGRLAVPMNEEEEKQIYELINETHTSERRYWIGVEDKDEEMSWSDASTGQPLQYTHFDTKDSQPDNYNDEDCVEMSNFRTRWNDRDCKYGGTGYVCEYLV